jgi:hypothetical protein
MRKLPLTTKVWLVLLPVATFLSWFIDVFGRTLGPNP